MLYREHIEKLRKEWTGKAVMFEGKEYKVMGVDYNGMLLIDKPNINNETTAVDAFMLDK